MINWNKHRSQFKNRKDSSLKIFLLLVCAVCLFQTPEISAQVVGIINNENAAITVTDAAAVDARTFENRLYNTNHGEINLLKDYIITGTGATNGNGHFNLGGDWTNTGVYFPDYSTVQFYGDSLQTITHAGGEFFHNLIINNTGSSTLRRNRVLLPNNVTVTNSLTFYSGNFVTQGATTKLFLETYDADSLKYLSTNRSRVIGRFERGLNSTSNYLFPIGSGAAYWEDYYNPLNLKPNVTPTPGSLLAEFFPDDPGNQGLPITDPSDSVEVDSVYTDGYWSLTPYNNFQSLDYDINMKGAGFSDTIHDIASVIKRDGLLTDWEVFGTHQDANEADSVAYRNNVDDGFDGNGNGNHFAFGHTRPKIVEQPEDTSVCDQTPAWFEVRARWRKRVSYQWQVLQGAIWVNLSDGPIYSGTSTSRLDIPLADRATMDGNQYRVIVTHKHGHYNISDPATLTVNPIPEAVATPDRQILCNEGTTNITLTERNLIPVDSFGLEIIYSGNITGWTSTLNGSTSIIQTLTNNGSDVDSVIYRITPYGIPYTYCEGIADIAVVVVNPTPTLFASVPDTLYCNGDTAFFSVNNSQETTGTVKYDLRVGGHTGDFAGQSLDTDGLNPAVPDPDFYDVLSHAHAEIRQLDYLFIPYIEDSNVFGGPECYNGFDTTVIVRMVPVLTGFAEPDTFIGGDNIRCFSESNGKIGLTPTGGDYRYQYQFVWEDNNGDTLQNQWNAPLDSLDNQPVGTYSYSITDTIGCSVPGSFVLTQPDTLNVIETQVLPTCNGLEDGSILRTISGGHEGYKGYWRNTTFFVPFDSTINTYNVPKGFYLFNVRDTNGCFYEIEDTFLDAPDDVTTIIPNRSSSNFDNTYDIQCYGGLGWIEVQGNTGQAPFSYEWFAEGDLVNPISTDAVLMDVPAGTYHYLVTDDNGCIDLDAYKGVEVTEPDSIVIEKMNPQYTGDWDISCYGEDDGTLNLQYTGGHIHQYKNDFLWDGPGVSGHTDSIKVETLIAGIYSVTITDEFDCFATFTDTLEQPTHIGFSITPKEYIGPGPINVSCFGFEDGDIVFDTIYGGGPNGGTATYTYGWTVTTDPPGYILPDPTTKDQLLVPAGTYDLHITDNIGCERDTAFALTQPDPLVSNSVVDTVGTAEFPKNDWEIRCYGFGDGEIDLEPTGGIGPYTYIWVGNGLSEGEQDQADLFEGEYRVTIEDENGCVFLDSFKLESPDTLVLRPSTRTIKCFGETDTIFLSPLGGETKLSFGEYKYWWEFDNSGDSLLADIPAGTYYIEVRDDNECVTSDSLVLTQNDEIISEIVVTSDYGGASISCYGESDGALRINIESGGVSPFNYQWIGSGGNLSGENTADITGLNVSGDKLTEPYWVEIIDDRDCKDTASYILTQPERLVFNQIQLSDPNCAAWNDGEIELYILGGTLPAEDPEYDISVNSEPLQGSLVADSLYEGSYSIQVKDYNQCSIDSTVLLVDPPPLYIEFDTISAECIDSDDGAILIVDFGGGVNPFPPEIEGYGSGMNFTRLISGEYLIHLADNTEGCYLDTIALVGKLHLSCLEPPTAFTPNGDSYNDTWILDEDEDGSTDMIYYPEAELRIYNRWGELIYYTNNVAYEPWDGTYKGRDMPVDSYFYILDLNNGEAPKRGHVTIIR